MNPAATIVMMALLAAVLAIVLSPLNTIRSRRGDGGGELADLEARREAKYQEIRDAELDFATGKLSAHDHEAVDATLRREALEILDEIEALQQAKTGAAGRGG